MKTAKRIGVFLWAVFMMLASTVYAAAISFDAETVYESVFVVYSGQSLGSGFAIGENCVITNAHVVERKSSIRIATYNGESYDGFLIACDEDLDIAVLGIPGVSFTPLKAADLSQMNVGDDVCAIGAPNSLAYTLTKGVLSAKARQVGAHTYIQTDAAINTGNSGGPLLNDAGEVVGVNSYKLSDSEGIGLAIPIDDVVAYLRASGIELDDIGNVAGAVDVPAEGTQETTAPQMPQEQKPEVPKTSEAPTASGTNPVLFVVLGVSVALNIILSVLLACKGRRKKTLPEDPSERTDFEIELLE